jgi:tRNA(Ile2) C34 agmatinyltransferase TiaS
VANTRADLEAGQRPTISKGEVMKPLRVADAVFRHPLCGVCGKQMRLMRREPHPKLGPKYELDTFECQSCGGTLEEDVGPTE